MIGARWRALVVVGVAAIAAAVFGMAAIRHERPGATPESGPKLLLLTSLPLLFNEDFSLQGGGSPAFKALQSHYQVVPISVAYLS
jgi:hypothetical protein